VQGSTYMKKWYIMPATQRRTYIATNIHCSIRPSVPPPLDLIGYRLLAGHDVAFGIEDFLSTYTTYPLFISAPMAVFGSILWHVLFTIFTLPPIWCKPAFRATSLCQKLVLSNLAWSGSDLTWRGREGVWSSYFGEFLNTSLAHHTCRRGVAMT